MAPATYQDRSKAFWDFTEEMDRDTPDNVPSGDEAVTADEATLPGNEKDVAENRSHPRREGWGRRGGRRGGHYGRHHHGPPPPPFEQGGLSGPEDDNEHAGPSGKACSGRHRHGPHGRSRSHHGPPHFDRASWHHGPPHHGPGARGGFPFRGRGPPPFDMASDPRIMMSMPFDFESLWSNNQDIARGLAEAYASQHGAKGGRHPHGPRGWHGKHFGRTPPHCGTDASTDHEPPVDIFSTDNAIVLHVPLAGAKKQNIDVGWEPEKRELKISGIIERSDDESLVQNLVVAEREDVGAFERRIDLGKLVPNVQVDGEGISARLVDGILTVYVPKEEEDYVQVRAIAIE